MPTPMYARGYASISPGQARMHEIKHRKIVRKKTIEQRTYPYHPPGSRKYYAPPPSYIPSNLVITKTPSGFQVHIPEKDYTFPTTYRTPGAAKSQVRQFLHTEARRAYWRSKGVRYPTTGEPKEEAAPTKRRIGASDITVLALAGKKEEAQLLAQYFGEEVPIEDGYYVLPTLPVSRKMPIRVSHITALALAGRGEEAKILARYFGKEVEIKDGHYVLPPEKARIGASDITALALAGKTREVQLLAQHFGKEVPIEKGYYVLPPPEKATIGVSDITALAIAGKKAEAKTLARHFGRTVPIKDGHYVLPPEKARIGASDITALALAGRKAEATTLAKHFGKEVAIKEGAYVLPILPVSPSDVAEPYGLITEADVQALERQGKSFTAFMVGRALGGAWLPTKEFEGIFGVETELPLETMVQLRGVGKEGYTFTYLPTEEWEELPAYVKERREPTFWEIPLYKHLEYQIGKAEAAGRQVRVQLFGEPHVQFMEAVESVTAPHGSPYGIVGTVKVLEATVGSVEALIGRPSVRSYIPTLGGALVATGITAISPIWGGEGVTPEYLKAEWESVKEHPEMVAGELLGEIILIALTSKAIGATWKGAKYVSGKVGVTQELKQIQHAIKFGRIGKAYHQLKLKVIEKTPLRLLERDRSFAHQLVGIKGAKTGLPTAFGYGKHLIKAFPETVGEAAARETVWSLMQTPKTAGWLITQAAEGTGFRATSKILKHLVFRGGQLSMGYLRELSFETDIVQQTARQRQLLLQINKIMGLEAQKESIKTLNLLDLMVRTARPFVEEQKLHQKSVERKEQMDAQQLFGTLPSIEIIKYKPRIKREKISAPTPAIFTLEQPAAREEEEVEVPSLLKWKGTAFPSIYAMERRVVGQRQKKEQKEREIQIQRRSQVAETVFTQKREKAQIIPPQLMRQGEQLIPRQQKTLIPKQVPIQAIPLQQQPSSVSPPLHPLLTTSVFRPPQIPEELRKFGAGVDSAIVTAWFMKRHPVMEPSEVAKHLLKTPTKPRKRIRSRIRRRSLANFILA